MNENKEKVPKSAAEALARAFALKEKEKKPRHAP